MPLPDWLPKPAASLIEATASALERALGKELEALFLVGAAMTPARQDRSRAPELVAIVAPRALDRLGALADALRPAMREGARVRVLSSRELERSCDVFTLEIADWRARHLLLRGKDPFGALAWTRADLRRSLETEVRGLSRRLRNRVLTGLATDGQRDDAARAIVDGLERLVTIAHHALDLLGDAPPSEEDALLRAIALRADANVEPLLALRKRARAGEKLDPLPALATLLVVIDAVAELVDRLEIGG
jgi:hypothetical protein